MKQKYFFLLTLFCVSLFSMAQTTTLPYNDDIYTGGYPSVTLNNFSTCQTAASITAASQRWNGSTWPDSNYSIIVNGTNIGTYTGSQTIDISSYLPIASVQMNGLYSSWSWVDLTVNITSNNASMPASGPTVTNVTYVQGDTASPLTAALNSTGATLKWYTDQHGDNYSATAPTPSTATVGTTSYWVAQANSSGCESVRSEIVVTVVANTPATHLNFDGTNDVVTVPNSSSLAFGTNNLTLEAMVKMSASQGNYSGIITKATTSTFVGIQFVVVNNKIALEFGNGTMLGVGNGLIGTTTLNDNNWHHVACVVDRANSNIKLYVDGVVEANVTNAFIGTANITTTTPLFIGKERNSIDYLESSIDEVRIWNVVRTPNQINGSNDCELAGTEPGLLAYYKFNYGIALANNAAVTTLTDATSNANNGTLSGFTLVGATSNWLAGSPVTTGSVVPSVATVTTPIAYNQGDTATALTATTGTNGTGLMWYTVATGGTGSSTAPTPNTAAAGNTSYWVSSTNANGCESERTELVVQVKANATHLNFDGVNDYVSMPASAINNLAQGTIEAWIYPTATILDNQTICAKQSNFENSYAVFSLGGESAANGKLFYKSKNGASIVSNATLSANQWTHVAVTFTNAQAKIFVNGTLDATASGDFSLPNDVTVTATALGAWLGDGNGQYFNGNIDEFRVWNVALNASDIANTMNCELQSGEINIVTHYKFNQGFDTASNTSITTLTDAVGSNHGTLTNFALTGTASNWKSGSPVAIGNSCATLSYDDFSAVTLKVYPNPSTGIFTISTKEDVNVKIFDLVGKMIKTQHLNNGDSTVDISGCTSGVYLLTVTNAKGDFRQYKLIKQ